MTMKHINFEESPIMRSLEQVAIKKGMFKESEVEKLLEKVAGARAEKKYEAGDGLVNDMFVLIAGLRDKGHIKLADSLEEKVHMFRMAEVQFYDVFGEDGEDLLDFAHPDGDIEVAPAQDEHGKVETPQSAHKKIVDKITKTPTGKYAQLATNNWSNQVDRMAKAFAEALASNGLDVDSSDVEDILSQIINEEIELNRIPRGISRQDADRIALLFEQIIRNNAAEWAAQIAQEKSTTGSGYSMDQAIATAAGGTLMSAIVAWRKASAPGEGEVGFATAKSEELTQKVAQALGLEKKAQTQRIEADSLEMASTFVDALKSEGLFSTMDIKWTEIDTFKRSVSQGLKTVWGELYARGGETPPAHEVANNFKRIIAARAKENAQDILMSMKNAPSTLFGGVNTEWLVEGMTNRAQDALTVAWTRSLTPAPAQKPSVQTAPTAGPVPYAYAKHIIQDLFDAKKAFDGWDKQTPQQLETARANTTMIEAWLKSLARLYPQEKETVDFSKIKEALGKGFEEFDNYGELVAWSRKVKASALGMTKQSKLNSLLEKFSQQKEAPKGPQLVGPTQPAQAPAPEKPQQKPISGSGAKPTDADKKAVREMQFALSNLGAALQKGMIEKFPETKAQFPNIVAELISTSADKPEKPIGPSQFDGWWGPNTSAALSRAEALRVEWNKKNPEDLITNPIDAGGSNGMRHVPGHGAKAKKNAETISVLQKKSFGDSEIAGGSSVAFDKIPRSGDPGAMRDVSREGAVVVTANDVRSLYNFALFLQKNNMPFYPKAGVEEPFDGPSVAFHYLWRYILLLLERAKRIAEFNPALADYYYYMDKLNTDLQRVGSFLSKGKERTVVEDISAEELEADDSNLADGEGFDPETQRRKVLKGLESLTYVPLRYLKDLGSHNAKAVSPHSVPSVQKYVIQGDKLVPSSRGNIVIENGKAVYEGNSFALSRERHSPQYPPVWETLVLERGEFRKYFGDNEYLPELDLDEVRFMDTWQLASLLFGGVGEEVDDLTDASQSYLNKLDKFLSDMKEAILPQVYKDWEQSAGRDPRVKRQSRQFLREWYRAFSYHQKNIRSGRRPQGRYRQYTYR